MQPQLFNFNGQPTLDSREVAKMIGKSHKHLMRDIRQYIKDMTLGPNLDPAQFFIESNYKDAYRSFAEDGRHLVTDDHLSLKSRMSSIFVMIASMST